MKPRLCWIWLRKGLPWLAGGLAGALLAAALHALCLLASGNFHTVVPGQLYRSGQLSAPQLERQIHAHQIKTVVNLQGWSDADWHQQEYQTAEKCAVTMVDVRLNASRLPFVPDLVRLMDAFERCPRPLLVHCKMGADRAGLASALFLLLETDAGLAEARRQLHLRYGHIRLGSVAAPDEFLDMYADWLRDQGREHAPAALRWWIENDYCAGEYRYTLEPLDVPDEVSAGTSATVRIRLHNTSIRPWRFRADKDKGIHVGYLVTGPNRFVEEGRAALLDTVVQPGNSIDVTVTLPVLAEPGQYRLIVDMVNETGAWFVNSGCQPLQTTVNVR